MTVTHDDILARLAQPWIDIVPSRRALAKRALPAHADKPSPNVIVSALPTDKTALDVCGQFRLRHWKPRFNEAHVPTDYAWQFIAPSGERLMVFTWVNWLRNSRKMFEDYCRETGREFGALSPEGFVTFGAKTIPFRECRLVHQDEIRPRPPVSVQCKSAKAVLSKAENLLKRRTSQFEDIDYRDFYDDEEAHDEELQGEMEANFRVNFARYENALTKKYGSPALAGSDEHIHIPINGVLRHVIWTVGKKSLYLALSHEDLELPWVIYLGVKI